MALERALGDGWRHERIELSSGRAPVAALRSLPLRLPALARGARAADVVHLHGDMAAVLALPAVRGTPLLLTTHGLHFLRRASGAPRALFAAALRRAAGRCVAVLCTSAAERDELAALAPGARLSVVHNAVPPRGTPPDRDAARAELGLAGEDVVALFAGQLEERKRPLPAARAALAAGAPVVMVVAGDGPQASELRALAGERLRLVGHVPDLAPLLAAADVFVAPAEREGLSYALLEAMAAGLAVVASDAPGNDEAIGDAGVRVAVGDEAALARELAALAADAELRRRLGCAARERALTAFGEERFAEAVRNAYADAAAARQAGSR